MSIQNKKWVFAFFLLALISLKTAQARYEWEAAFIETMPQVHEGKHSAIHSIQRLNSGMMNRGTVSELPFSTQLWRETSSACTNGSLYGLRKTPITAEEFKPLALNIIMQASGLERRDAAYFYSFSEEGFKDQQLAAHQLHHFFFMRAAQIAQEPQAKQRTQDLASRISHTIYSDLLALSKSLPLAVHYSAEDIRQSLTRFGSLFFTLLERDQKTIHTKVEADPADSSWANEGRIAFICDQGEKRLNRQGIPSDSLLRRAYQQIKGVVDEPAKIATLVEDLQYSSDLDSRKSRSHTEVDNTKHDLEHILFLATPTSYLPPQIEVPMEAVPAKQLPTGLAIKKGNVRVFQGSVGSYPAVRFEQSSLEAILVFERFWVGDNACVQVVRTLPDAVTSIYQTSGEPQFLLGPVEVQGGKRINIYAPYSQQFRGFPTISNCTLQCRKMYTENPSYPLRKPL